MRDCWPFHPYGLLSFEHRSAKVSFSRVSFIMSNVLSQSYQVSTTIGDGDHHNNQSTPLVNNISELELQPKVIESAMEDKSDTDSSSEPALRDTSEGLFCETK